MTVRLFLLAGALALLAACADVGKNYQVQLQGRQHAYDVAAGGVVDSFQDTSLWSWEPLSDTRLAVYTRADQAWLLDLKKACRNLRFTNHIELTSADGAVTAQRDRVITGPGDVPCVITQIRSVDMAKLRDPPVGQPREVEKTSRSPP